MIEVTHRRMAMQYESGACVHACVLVPLAVLLSGTSLRMISSIFNRGTKSQVLGCLTSHDVQVSIAT